VNFEFYLQIFETYSNIKFHENPSSGNQVVPRGRAEGRADLTKLKIAFRSFAHVAPKLYP